MFDVIKPHSHLEGVSFANPTEHIFQNYWNIRYPFQYHFSIARLCEKNAIYYIIPMIKLYIKKELKYFSNIYTRIFNSLHFFTFVNLY
ncbi:hypothetical protein T4B_6429 [Trichinella pseudospiralis]|uniref:Uncharacterized protein n=1 Tax=Trichinella pseudospiralis TaxID=6337 RepID=A0A0V1JVI6_TRIPS|nr:hypothetical protein T4A_11775 [Trichinella pseudospiralis]KRZ32169.1 hypothetical protein T4B_6429 [Trichinella pseudospiralis]KRZ38978.1 hypothetical protein T4C_3004 [Trichinella pseudospiralis]